MRLSQADLLEICRAKLTEASHRDPHLGIIVAHSNLLEALTTHLMSTCDGSRARGNPAPHYRNELQQTNKIASDAGDGARSGQAEAIVKEYVFEECNVRQIVFWTLDNPPRNQTIQRCHCLSSPGLTVAGQYL